MPDGAHLRHEGDTNRTDARAGWLARVGDAETTAWLARDAQSFIHQSLSTPCLDVLQGASGIYLEDLQGRRIMDFHGNSVHQVGYGHPEVVAAVRAQLERLPFSPRRYTNRPAVELAERLARLAPPGFGRVLFAPAATVATSMALKLARIVTGRYKTLSTWDSFHGVTMDAISVGGEAMFHAGLGPLLPGNLHVPPCAPGRCPWRCGGECALHCADLVEYVLDKEGEVGAVILEAVRNTDVRVPPRAYLERIRAACDRHGALLIFDETATGLGRTGRMFAFEHFGVAPDIVILGKGLGGGVMPLAAIIARDDLNRAADMSIGHVTHEKSPLGAAAALATLDVIEREDLVSGAQALGARLGTRLRDLAARSGAIGEVRGLGLLHAVEFADVPEAGLSAAAVGERVMYAALARGLSFKVSQGNVALLAPPLVIREPELDAAVAILEESVQEALRGGPPPTEGA